VDYAPLRGYRADRLGNVQFRGGSQNFNPSFARAARVAIVEVDEIVEPGAIPPELIDLPGMLRGARREDHARGRRQGPGSSRTAPT
jgi:3-oxoacid CoA-transferase